MRVIATLLSAVAATLVLYPAQASELAPVEGMSIALGDVVGTAYYTVEGEGYQVVTTIVSGEAMTPFRVTTTLLSGQRTTFSVPSAVGQSALEVEIRRIGDRVFVNEGGIYTGLDQEQIVR